MLNEQLQQWLTQAQTSWSAEYISLWGLLNHQDIPNSSREKAIATAQLLENLGLDRASIVTSLIQGCAVQPSEADMRLWQVQGLLEGLKQLQTFSALYQNQGGKPLDNLRKMLLVMAQDVRAVVVMLAALVVAMRALKEVDDELEQRRIAKQTQDIFAPLANRLGLAQLKWELEDLSLRYLEPESYRRLALALDERRSDREHYIENVKDELRQLLKQSEIKGEVTGRVKHLYSIWKKMQQKGRTFDELFDVRAVRIMVDSIADCYTMLGHIHEHWQPIPKEFDDYIANPKPNGYQSLHTAVLGPADKTLEVQIRTTTMHQHAELGVAAHWRYKEGKQAGTGQDQQLAWLRQMLDNNSEDADVLEQFTAEVFTDHVYVVSPKGQAVELIAGATPLDFAYHIHTELGHRCRGAKVNGRIVPLTYELKNGDKVEVLTAKLPAPSRDWLSPHLGYLKSVRARGKVRLWFKQQDVDKNVLAGKQMLEREFSRLNLHPTQDEIKLVADKLNVTGLSELYAGLGFGDITLGQVLNRISLPEKQSSVNTRHQAVSLPQGRGLHVQGVGNLLTQLAVCCKPAPPELIGGFITQGRGVSIHRANCSNYLHLIEQQPERCLEVNWGDESDAHYAAEIVIEAFERASLLKDISSIIANDRIKVLRMNMQASIEDGQVCFVFTLEIQHLNQLSRVLDRINQLPNVIEAKRQSK